MKLSSNQRKHLEALANKLDPVIRIGKNGLDSKIVKGVSEALDSHELVKIKILESCAVEKEEILDVLIKGTNASLVRMIGRVIILFKPFSNKPSKIELPKAKS